MRIWTYGLIHDTVHPVKRHIHVWACHRSGSVRHSSDDVRDYSKASLRKWSTFHKQNDIWAPQKENNKYKELIEQYIVSYDLHMASLKLMTPYKLMTNYS